MPISLNHPFTLVVIALFSIPALIPLARFFFDDLETFLNDLGYRADDDTWWKIIRLSQYNIEFILKLIALVGCYVILVGLTYSTAVSILY
jgi:hypothetical protein